MYALFSKGHGHKALGEGHHEHNCKFLLQHFKGTKALTKRHGGTRNAFVVLVKYQA